MEHLQAQYSTAKAALQKAEAEVARLGAALGVETQRGAMLSTALSDAAVAASSLKQMQDAVAKAYKGSTEDGDLPPLSKVRVRCTSRSDSHARATHTDRTPRVQLAAVAAAAARTEALDARVDALQRDADAAVAAEAEARSEAARADAAEAARDRVQRELMTVIADAATYQDQVEVLKADATRLQKQVLSVLSV